MAVTSFRERIFAWLAREWLLVTAALGLALSSAFLARLPRFSSDELEVLFLLWLLFVAVKGLEKSGLMAWVSRYLERGGRVPLKLVLITFFLAALVTNDVALVVVVPLTLAMNTDRKGALVMIEAFAANSGSALTPFGNPQNLYLYWHYQVEPLSFVTTIAPFGAAYLALLAGAAFLMRTGARAESSGGVEPVERAATVYLALLIVLVLVVLRVLPFYFSYVVAAGVLVFGRRALTVDYALLLTFLVFFGLVDNVKYVLAPLIEHAGHVFLAAAASSQLIGNVPAALLLAEFTSNWQALLWGVSVGGFGSLIASFANLIAYRFFIKYQGDPVKRRAFTWRFMLYGYLLFALGVGLYFASPFAW